MQLALPRLLVYQRDYNRFQVTSLSLRAGWPLSLPPHAPPVTSHIQLALWRVVCSTRALCLQRQTSLLEKKKSTFLLWRRGVRSERRGSGGVLSVPGWIRKSTRGECTRGGFSIIKAQEWSVRTRTSNNCSGICIVDITRLHLALCAVFKPTAFVLRKKEKERKKKDFHDRLDSNMLCENTFVKCKHFFGF